MHNYYRFWLALSIEELLSENLHKEFKPLILGVKISKIPKKLIPIGVNTFIMLTA